LQTFNTLIVSRFQSINPDKDSGSVRGIANLKNEVKIITSPDKTFELWKEFLEKHSIGGLINPDIGDRFNQAKNFKVTKNFTLAREFFKHLGHFTDDDLKVFVQHLLRKTLGRLYLYPKVTVHKTSKLHISHYSAAEWVERRKKKMIVLQEFDALDGTLEFTRADGGVNNKKWKEWKKTHVVSIATWSILLCVIPGAYFAKRLTNKGKLKRAYEFQEKFLEVLHFLRNFLRLKNNFSVSGGSAKFRTLKRDSLEFGRDWTYEPGKRLSFALLDLRDTPGHNVPEDHVKNPHFSLLYVALRSMKTPSISKPAMWLWIVNSANRLAQAAEYARESFTNYTIRESKHILAKNERLYDGSARKQLPDVFLLFLVKNDDTEAQGLRRKIPSEYHAPNIPYYLEAGKYQELKYRLSSSELCMEFYLDLLSDFCRPGDRFLGVYSGSKCLVAAKVR
jgi:hypothetical protein